MTAGFTLPVEDWRRTRAADLVQPFRTVADAWFWTMAALVARRDGERGNSAGPKRPCEPDDVVKVLDRLYRQRRITNRHASVLRAYGESQVPPDATHPTERADALLWAEAMGRMEWPLRVKGIVA